MRADGRNPKQMRPIEIKAEVARYAEGSVEISFGHTRIFCTATVEPTAPKWLQGTGQGWVTAEYGMLPRSTHTRIQREKAMNSGRSQEISRLIGRALRAAVDLKGLSEKQIIIDCDVIQADGGTRTASITGGFVALALALKFMKDRGDISTIPLKRYVAAVSVGLSGRDSILDLCYEEDASCGTDMNFVMTNSDDFVEIQGTAEGEPFAKAQMDEMTLLAQKGCRELFLAQSQLLPFFPLNAKS